MDQVVVRGNQIGVSFGEERVLGGFDIEVGHKLPFANDLRVYAGAFHFDAAGFNSMSGERLRVEARFHDLPFLGKDSRLMLGAEITNDNIRDTEAYGLVQLRIPFGAVTRTRTPTHSRLERRMVDPIVRDVDVISTVGNSRKLRPVINPQSGRPISNVVRVTAADGLDIDEVIEGAGADSLAIIHGTVSSFRGINLQDGQILTGTGEPIVFRFSDSGDFRDISYIPRGRESKVLLVPAEGGTTGFISLANDSAINGLTISGGLAQVRANGVTNALIDNSILQDSISISISIVDSALLIENSVLRRTAGLSATDSTVSVVNTEFHAGGVFARGGELRLTDTLFENILSFSAVSAVGAKVFIQDSTISTVSGPPFTFVAIRVTPAILIPLFTETVFRADGELRPVVGGDLFGSIREGMIERRIIFGQALVLVDSELTIATTTIDSAPFGIVAKNSVISASDINISNIESDGILILESELRMTDSTIRDTGGHAITAVGCNELEVTGTSFVNIGMTPDIANETNLIPFLPDSFFAPEFTTATCP